MHKHPSGSQQLSPTDRRSRLGGATRNSTGKRGSQGGPGGGSSSHGGPGGGGSSSQGGLGGSGSGSRGASGDDGGSGGPGWGGSGSHGGSGGDGGNGGPGGGGSAGGGSSSNAGGGGNGGEAGHGGANGPGMTQGRSEAAVPGGFGVESLGLQPGPELQADPTRTLNPDTIHPELDHTVSRGLPPSPELNLSRGKSLPAIGQAKVAPETIVPGTDDTLATAHSHPWEPGDNRAKMLPSTSFELEDDDDANAGWKLVPYFGAALLFFSWIVQSGLGARKRKAASLKFEPDALRSIASVNGEERWKPFGARPPGLDKFAATFSIAGEPQQKAADEKKGAFLEHFSGDLHVEKARAEIEHAQEIEETFRKDFNGIGLS